MKKENLLTILIVIFIILAGILYIQKNQKTVKIFEPEPEPEPELMNLTVYIREDGPSTNPFVIQVPKTTSVADASLEYLFSNELLRYGTYKGVVIQEQVAYVSLANTNLPDGRNFSSLSSTESLHLISVINDTLTQYSSISQVVLLSSNGTEIIF